MRRMPWVLVVALMVLNGCGDDGTPKTPDAEALDSAADMPALDLGADQSTPDTRPTPDGAAPDTTPDSRADMALDLAPDVAPDVGPDIAPDLGPDLEPDITYDPNPNKVFVTSTRHAPSALKTLAAADAICAARAAAASLSGTFVAWLSTSTVNAKDRLGNARGWVTTDGKPVAATLQQLTSGRIWYPIGAYEDGKKSDNTQITTGTNAKGEVDKSPQGKPYTCDDYTTTTGNTLIGNSGGGAGAWTSYGYSSCTGQFRLYCFQTDYVAKVTATTTTGRGIFISEKQFVPRDTTGIPGADTLCQDEATAAGRTGTYKALLGMKDNPALSRFDTTKATWVRADGLAIADKAADLGTSNNLLVAVAFHADGTPAPARTIAWTGGGNGGPGGASYRTCHDEQTGKDWTKFSGGQGTPIFVMSRTRWFGTSGYGSCNRGRPIICMED